MTTFIGFEDKFGKGIGTEAHELLLRYLNNLNLDYTLKNTSVKLRRTAEDRHSLAGSQAGREY